jgi:hypothetical protein
MAWHLSGGVDSELAEVSSEKNGVITEQLRPEKED